jgi:hypothetical protein
MKRLCKVNNQNGLVLFCFSGRRRHVQQGQQDHDQRRASHLVRTLQAGTNRIKNWSGLFGLHIKNSNVYSLQHQNLVSYCLNGTSMFAKSSY